MPLTPSRCFWMPAALPLTLMVNQIRPIEPGWTHMLEVSQQMPASAL